MKKDAYFFQILKGRHDASGCTSSQNHNWLYKGLPAMQTSPLDTSVFSRVIEVVRLRNSIAAYSLNFK